MADPQGRSPTAASGFSDWREDILYSSIVMQSGGTADQKLFTAGLGSAILAMRGAGIVASLQAHHANHSPLTTSLLKPNEVAVSGLQADVRVTGISLTLESAPVTQLGVYSTYGATPMEVAEVCSKCWFNFSVGGKIMQQGSLEMFPAAGGVSGGVGISQTVTNTTNVVGFCANGNALLGGRRLKDRPIPIGRTDPILGTIAVANGAALVFSRATTDGQPFLLKCVLGVRARADVR
jgi:hypothetical protein